MSDTYIILSETKYSSLPSTWSVEFFGLSYDNAFTKLVALETLKDNDDKVYYIINKKHLWSKTTDVKLDNVDINKIEKQDALF
tara:strand:- start:142 stop:390 length:249 start_codon:yes stop_codon:yes gene_type:complete